MERIGSDAKGACHLSSPTLAHRTGRHQIGTLDLMNKLCRRRIHCCPTRSGRLALSFPSQHTVEAALARCLYLFLSIFTICRLGPFIGSHTFNSSQYQPHPTHFGLRHSIRFVREWPHLLLISETPSFVFHPVPVSRSCSGEKPGCPPTTGSNIDGFGYWRRMRAINTGRSCSQLITSTPTHAIQRKWTCAHALLGSCCFRALFTLVVLTHPLYIGCSFGFHPCDFERMHGAPPRGSYCSHAAPGPLLCSSPPVLVCRET